MEEAPLPAEMRAGITDEDECPYLPSRRWRNLVLDTRARLTDDLHGCLLDQGFRRMGHYMYRPVCEGCAECRPLRVDVRRFHPTRSQRRAWRRNRDLRLVVGPPHYDEEKRDLLERYLARRHTGPMVAEEQPMRDFMFDSPGETLCLELRAAGRLVGCGLLDITPEIGSSLYFFFDPDETRRSLGIYSMLVEIELTKERRRRWYHPGFYVAGCSAMSYKAAFRPCEILDQTGTWRRLTPGC